MQVKTYSVLETRQTQDNNTISLHGINNNKGQTLIIGVVHGDEPQGKWLIEKYMSEYLNENVLFIPCLNPDGLAKTERTNSNGVDINRNFPTKNWECTEQGFYYGGEKPASEIETQFLVDVIDKYEPSVIITLHAPYKVVNYDGPAQEIARKIAHIIDYPVEANIGYPTPGSFGTYAGVERSIPTITLELDEFESLEKLYEPIKQIFEFRSAY